MRPAVMQSPAVRPAHPDAPPPGSAQTLASHAAMVAELRRPGACAGFGDVPGLVQTHLSSLLFCGGLVYKLKKPLALGFVDFSTLAAREDACEQELRLNRRTAPRLYLGRVAVRQGPQGAFICEPGAVPPPGCPVIDWAVQMRRFDDSRRLDRLAEAGQLRPDHIDALASTVAHFHAQQLPAPPGNGRAHATRHWARDNANELATLAGQAGLPAAQQAQLAALQAWTETRGAVLAPLMTERARSGHVRELHGDLHLANLVLLDGHPVLFDALEFNPLLRCIDTVGELAFPFMDLVAHGQPRLAWRFINAVWEITGDHDALPLLAWWAVYRALVRAKVALLGAAQAAPATPGVAPHPGLAEARRYLGVASRLAQLDQAPPPTARAAAPLLVLTMGLAGSGKSSAAVPLASRLGALRVRSDVERKRLFGQPATARAVPGLYSPETNQRTYQRLQALAALALDNRTPVVVDAASLRRSERDAMRALAARHGGRFLLLLCHAAVPVLQMRVQQRQQTGLDASDATTQVLAAQQQWVEWPGPDEAASVLRLDTGPADWLARLDDWFSAAGLPAP